jgi:NADH dehydrogenase [ubiquinone] 1 alpha subcomplex assembly factor 6
VLQGERVLAGGGGQSYAAAEVRRLDPDRFLTALFAPVPAREDLLALYAFNLEVARIAELVSEPMVGEIRLQWWREAVEGIYKGNTRRHEVVEALAAAIDRAALPHAVFDRLIETRFQDLDENPPATLDEFIAYAEGTSSTLSELAVRLLAKDAGPEALLAARRAGLGWALCGILRAIPFHGAQGRVLLPLDLLAAHNVDPHDILHGRSPEGLKEIVKIIHGQAVTALQAARALKDHVPKAAVPALLPVTLASGYLKALARAGFDPFSVNYDRGAGPRRLALIVNGLSGRF